MTPRQIELLKKVAVRDPRYAKMAGLSDVELQKLIAADVPNRPISTFRLPCLHEGPIVESCTQCGNQEHRHVRMCNHPTTDRDKCTRLFVSAAVQACAACSDYSSPDHEYQDRLRKVLVDPGVPPVGSGDGIIYVGGGRYWDGIVVGCRLLRESGCTLPIEVWYRKRCERVYPDEVAGLNVTLIDADELSFQLGDNAIPLGNSDIGGWEAKTYAFTHTKLARFLFLDADAYCVDDPTPMFSVLKQRPFAFWTDVATQQGQIRWERVLPEITAVGKSLPPVQGGQLLFDRSESWAMIATAHHISQNSSHYWPDRHNRNGRLMYGDQDAWLVPLAAGAGKWLNLGVASWRNRAFVCEWEGRPMIVHRCQSKLYGPELASRISENEPQSYLPKEKRVFEILSEIRNKRVVDPKRVFGNIYARGLWGNGSGAGSSPQELLPYVNRVNAFAKEKGWKSCLDLGCGDCQVSSRLHFPEYTGVDVVPSGCTNLEVDFRTDLESLPAADVLLCKDVLHHWPNAWITDWIERLKKLVESGRWKCAILTQDSFQSHDGDDTYLGGYRALSPEMEPLKSLGLQVLMTYNQKTMLMIP